MVVSFFPVGVPVPSGLSMRTTIVRLTTIHNLEEQSIVNMQKVEENGVNLAPFSTLTIPFRPLLKITFKAALKEIYLSRALRGL